MIKKWWWAIKVFFFPALDRRRTQRCPGKDRRGMTGKQRMVQADDMLATAIMDLSELLDRTKK